MFVIESSLLIHGEPTTGKSAFLRSLRYNGIQKVADTDELLTHIDGRYRTISQSGPKWRRIVKDIGIQVNRMLNDKWIVLTKLMDAEFMQEIDARYLFRRKKESTFKISFSRPVDDIYPRLRLRGYDETQVDEIIMWFKDWEDIQEINPNGTVLLNRDEHMSDYFLQSTYARLR